MKPPLLRLPGQDGGQDVVFSGFVLTPGVLVPQVIRPIIRGRRDDGAIRYGTAGREWALHPPEDLDLEDGEVSWEPRREAYSPHTAVGGVIRQLLMTDILTTATTRHRCGPCGAAGPWAAEWVTGALLATARLECRTCWCSEDRYPAWVVELVRRIQPRILPDGADVDLEG